MSPAFYLNHLLEKIFHRRYLKLLLGLIFPFCFFVLWNTYLTLVCLLVNRFSQFFVAPLMKTEAMEREVLAVDSGIAC